MTTMREAFQRHSRARLVVQGLMIEGDALVMVCLLEYVAWRGLS